MPFKPVDDLQPWNSFLLSSGRSLHWIILEGLPCSAPQDYELSPQDCVQDILGGRSKIASRTVVIVPAPYLLNQRQELEITFEQAHTKI